MAEKKQKDEAPSKKKKKKYDTPELKKHGVLSIVEGD